jgi:hypothetical protein
MQRAIGQALGLKSGRAAEIAEALQRWSTVGSKRSKAR